MLLAASVLVFIIACSNVANLILARTVRREGELAIRAALGASTGALRRTLLAESLLLCGAGAVLGVLIARPMVAILARYASRFSVRALDLTVDASLLWVGVALAIAAAVLLAFVPRLPSADASQRPRPVERQRADHRRHQPPAARCSPSRRSRASFVLLAGAGMLLTTLLALQRRRPASTRTTCWRVNVPVMSYGRDARTDRAASTRKRSRRISALPGVERVAVGTIVPWRDAGTFGPGFQFSAEGYVEGATAKKIRARASARSRRDSSRRSACRSSPAAISTTPTAAAASRW